MFHSQFNTTLLACGGFSLGYQVPVRSPIPHVLFVLSKTEYYKSPNHRNIIIYCNTSHTLYYYQIYLRLIYPSVSVCSLIYSSGRALISCYIHHYTRDSTYEYNSCVYVYTTGSGFTYLLYIMSKYSRNIIHYNNRRCFLTFLIIRIIPHRTAENQRFVAYNKDHYFLQPNIIL